MIKSSIIFVTCCLILYVSFGQKKLKSNNIDVTIYGLNDTLVREWKKDTNGCLWLRGKHINTIKDNQKLIGLSEHTILKIFGNPDEKESNVFGYKTGGPCDARKQTKKGSDIIVLYFTFNNDHLVEWIDLSCAAM